MKIWISGEVDADVFEPFRLAINDIEAAINSVIARKEYGRGIKGWTYIAVVMTVQDPPFDNWFPEIKKYHKKNKRVEFRLAIDHQRFKKGRDTTKRKLLFASILRSIALLEELGIEDCATDRLRMDIFGLGKKKGWL